MPPLEELRNDPAERRVSDQPRPALGLRPWFALLRRARSLRRFALAIRPKRITAAQPNCPIYSVVSAAAEPLWQVAIPRNLLGRARGIRAVADGHGVLLAGSMVHGRRLAEPICVVALDRSGRVLAKRVLLPGKLWFHRGAVWMLELPEAESCSQVGRQVRLLVSPHDCS